MPSTHDEFHSDSDEESEVETSVLLGVPDGPVTSAPDLLDVAVSRIGGNPVFLPSNEPSRASSHCKNCSCPMELLVQLWCPRENSPMDRALYVWGCARGRCQRKEGSVRAWRGLRFNADYAKKLAKKHPRKDDEKAQSAANDSPSNPFSQSTQPSQFGLGHQIFTSTLSDSALSLSTEDDTSDTESHHSESLDNAYLVSAMASVMVDTSPWASAPSYPALYMSTMEECLPPSPRNKLLSSSYISGLVEENDWVFEGYEHSLDIDHVFERFAKRVSHEGGQCVRYELNGIPLPFSSDDVFDKLFPLPPPSPLPVTKATFKVVAAAKRTYQPASVSPCSFCHSKRVFECQLMPNLINVLALANKSDGKTSNTDLERRNLVEKTMKGDHNGDEKHSMEWGTCMVFSCQRDCCDGDDGKEGKECWMEEIVLVQWDQ